MLSNDFGEAKKLATVERAYLSERLCALESLTGEHIGRYIGEWEDQLGSDGKLKGGG